MGQRAADQTNRPTLRTFTVEAVEIRARDVQAVSTATPIVRFSGVSWLSKFVTVGC